MEEVSRYKGKHAWMEKVPDFRSVPEAIIKNEGRGISFDYMYKGVKLGVELKSKDGIFFKGTYESDNYERGNCIFTLYKNEKGCFLYGEYNSDRDGCGKWLVELENENEKEIG